jgi:opacity protein-like surface antigen
MKALIVSCLFASAMAWGTAQAQNSGGTWEFGGDVVYQDSTTVSFEGGTRIDFEEDWGIALKFGYNFNEHLQLTFALDWQEISYDADFVSSNVPGLGFGVSGDMEAFVPQVGLTYNFGQGPFRPFVSGEIGWAFVDTNIPNGRVQVGCWWDPWWGQICTPYQSTKSVDEFVYGVGAGVRWDFSPGYSMQLAYEKHWYDYSQANSTPDFDQLRLGFTFSY